MPPYPPEDRLRRGESDDSPPDNAFSLNDLDSPDTSEADTLPFFAGVRDVPSHETDHELLIDRRAIELSAAEQRAQDLEAIAADLHLMCAVNRDAGENAVYAGFKFVRTAQAPSPEELTYLDAFLPLRVAVKYPELLLNDTIGYDDVYSSDDVPRGTRVVVRPGEFRILGRSRLGEILGSTLACCLYLFAAAVGVVCVASRLLR